MSNFSVTQSLPETGCTREMIYNLLRTLAPNDGLLDGVSLGLTGGVLAASNAVPFWRKYTVTHSQFQAAGMSNSVELFVLPAGGIVHAVKIKPSILFAGTGITDYKVSVGITGNLTKYAAAFDVDAAVSDTNFQLSTTVGGETHAAAGTSIKAAATTTGANLDQSTAGSVDIWVLWSATA